MWKFLGKEAKDILQLRSQQLSTENVPSLIKNLDNTVYETGLTRSYKT